MFIGILNTWTIFVLLPVVLLKFSLGAPANNVTLSGGMYDAIAKRCPNLDQTTLKTIEILTKRCLNWKEINVTNSFSEETKENIQCLVFYEALVSFCTNMGDSLLRVKGIIPSNSTFERYSLKTVCSDKLNIYSINKTEHNISSLVQNNEDCMLLCSAFTKTRVSELCLYAYYFGTFDVINFKKKLEEVHPSQVKPELDHAQEVKNNPSESETEPKNTKQGNELKDSTSKGPNVTEPPKESHPGLQPSENKGEKEELKPGKKEVLKSGENEESKPVNQSGQKTIAPDVDNKTSKPSLLDKSTQDELLDPNVKKDFTGDGLGDDYPDDGPAQQDMRKQEETFEKPDESALSNDLKTASKNVKPDEPVNSFNAPDDDMDGDSYFFSYFTVLMCLCIVGYVGYHNRQKILALILEGKKGRRAGRRRPNSANYHKLDTNLEEAISSSCTKNASNVIY